MFLFLKDSRKHFISKNKSVSESYGENKMKFLYYTGKLFKICDTNNISEAGLLKKIYFQILS